MADYDVGKAFEEIEDKLISSMIRNLKNHQAEEITEGYNWTQWQAEQLAALEKYRKDNQEVFSEKFKAVNQNIQAGIANAYKQGGADKEIKILENIQKGFTNYNYTGDTETTGEFFKTNENKMNALIKATTNDMEKAETATLRLANDQYRKIIFNAQVYANTGAGTYEKAVDMATKDFLSAGINCIEYKNGRRVNIKSYADMAIRTANKRAYLQGEGAMRQEWGIHTVILNKRGNACPLCLPFVGKVFIDDVWSGGTAEEAKEKGYPLLSEAIAQGLYHPNCRDAHTTYFEGINTPPDEKENSSENTENSEGKSSESSEKEPLTEEEKQQAKELYNAEQKQQYAERQAERMERMSKYSLDEDNKKIYGSRAKQWRSTAEEYEGKVTVHKKESNIEDLVQYEEIKISKKEKSNSYSVDRNLVNAKAYHDKFEKLTPHKSANEALCSEAKRILEQRDGYESEAMSIINSRTGERIVTNLENPTSLELKTGLTKEQYEIVKNSGTEFIIIHNHPGSTRPSGTDILTLWRESKATASIIVGHDGTVYSISNINRKIPLDKIYEEAYNNYKKLGYDDTFSKKKATDDLYALNAFTFERR